MKIKFLKDQKWTINGAVINFIKGTHKEVPEKYAQAMLKHGYGEIFEPVKDAGEVQTNIIKDKNGMKNQDKEDTIHTKKRKYIKKKGNKGA